MSECKNCPYGNPDSVRRMNQYHGVKEKYGTPNEVYSDMTETEAEAKAEAFLWCDKVGGKIFVFGKCEDAVELKKSQTFIKKRMRKTKYERNRKYKQHLKKLYENVGLYYPAPVTYEDEFINGLKRSKPYYRRRYRGNGGGCSRQHKKTSNRKIRRYKGSFPKGFACHKLYDYWYEMF